MPVSIDRAQYVALRVPDPEAAARFATDHMGLTLAAQRDETFYLRGHGLDPYCLSYTAGPDSGIDRIGYLVADDATLHDSQAQLDAAGVPVQTVENPAHRDQPPHRSLRFTIPGRYTVELNSTGQSGMPMAQRIPPPEAVPGPISCDHAVVRSGDMPGMYTFMTGSIGLKESARIQDPDEQDVITFLRGKTLFHCFAYAHSAYHGLHHLQLTVKNPPALYAAYEAMQTEGVRMVWGPVRHGPGHNIAFYFFDADDNIIEYSCEEEIILDDDTYTPRTWSTTDQKSLDEWGSAPPSFFFQ
jgi:catechol 2,3-dioxygenase-like lactoylglutathione lyase family enzyme